LLRCEIFRYVPQPAVSTRSKMCIQNIYSITSSARASSNLRHSQAARLGGREIDDELQLGWLLDRQIVGLAPLMILST
jgi:hypothetical protein